MPPLDWDNARRQDRAGAKPFIAERSGGPSHRPELSDGVVVPDAPCEGRVAIAIKGHRGGDPWVRWWGPRGRTAAIDVTRGNEALTSASARPAAGADWLDEFLGSRERALQVAPHGRSAVIVAAQPASGQVGGVRWEIFVDDAETWWFRVARSTMPLAAYVWATHYRWDDPAEDRRAENAD